MSGAPVEPPTEETTDIRARRLGVALWARVARFYNRNMRLSANNLRPWNLNVAQFDVIAQIGAHEGITQQELAKSLLVTEGNVTQLLEKLEERRLIQRSRDGRIKRLTLTPDGLHLRDCTVPLQERFQVEQFSALTLDEQRTLLALLGKLRHASGAA